MKTITIMLFVFFLTVAIPTYAVFGNRGYFYDLSPYCRVIKFFTGERDINCEIDDTENWGYVPPICDLIAIKYFDYYPWHFVTNIVPLPFYTLCRGFGVIPESP